MGHRLQQIVEEMNIQPGDRILEIGCGHGVAATFVCQRLKGGQLTAVDRSRKMIEAAKRRNAREIAAGQAEFILGSLEELDLGNRRFDKIFAIRVGIFLRQPDHARSTVEKWLAPEGKLFIFFDPPRQPEARSFSQGTAKGRAVRPNP
jgi:ubiquinone/menaquinone biosynthesis C-methylase UbiE